MFENCLSPITIGKTTIKNRMFMSPMGGGYGDAQGPHGEFTLDELEYLTERAKGGFGLIFVGSIYPDYKVDPTDPSFNFMLHKADFKKRAAVLVERTRVYGTKLIQQISMGLGRNGEGTYSCSPVPYTHAFGNTDTPLAPELTKEQIKDKIDCLIEAAALMKECGYAGVEIHAMHWGYLLDNFAMAMFNTRTDEYGGSLENRTRAAKEIVQGVKAACGDDFLVSIRLGLQTYIKDLDHSTLTGDGENGRDLNEAIEIAKLLESYGYDMLSVDVGLYESFYHACPPSHMPLGNAIDMAAEVKKAVNIPVLCGSRMNDPVLTDKAIAEGKIDAAVLGRPALADPYYVAKLEQGRPEKIRPCIGCLVGCMGKLHLGEYGNCAVNPAVRKELSYGIVPTAIPKKIAVIGGGVAGMEAARTCRLRGHDVTIYEKSDKLGGLLYAAGAPSFKVEMNWLIDWYKSEIKDLNIPVEYNTVMNAEKVKELKPDAVILALGSGSLMPGSIKGIDHPKAVSFIDAHNNKDMHKDAENIVVIGGGLVGCETALDYAIDGKKVTVVEALPEILKAGTTIPLPIRQLIPELFSQYDIPVMTSYRLEEINDEGAVVAPVDGGDAVTLKADSVIIAIGRKKEASFADSFRGCGIPVYTAGDMDAIGNVYTCVHDAYEIARGI